MNILKNDPFTKTVFTDVLPSNRLPREIRKRPRGYILNTDPSDKPGSHWVAVLSYRRWQRGILGLLWSGSWILQSELYSIFGQTLWYIYVEQKNFASPIIRRVWTIYIILRFTSM
jgi:hypothetical protein